MKQLIARIYFTENVLGTRPNNEDLIKDYIANNADADKRSEEIKQMQDMKENEDFNELFEKQLTVFDRTKKGDPMFWDYQWKGYFKEKCAFIKKNNCRSLTLDTTPIITPEDAAVIAAEVDAIAESKKSKTKSKITKAKIDAEKPISASIKAFKKEIDGNIFVFPRKIVIHTEDPIKIFQRPLRAEGPQGVRVALSASEEIHGGAWCEIRVECHIEERIDAVREWLDYGRLHGTGQWRNSGAGRFLWAELDENGNQIGGNFTEKMYIQLREEAEL